MGSFFRTLAVILVSDLNSKLLKIQTKRYNTKVMATSTSLMRLIILGDEHTFAFAEETRFTADAFVSTIKTDSSYTKYISIFIFLFLRNKENQRQKLYVM